MIFKPEIKINLGNMRWIDATGISCPYLAIFDATDFNPVDMLREDRDYLEYPILSVSKLYGIMPHNGSKALLTKKFKVHKRWIPRGYELEYHSYTLEPFAIVVVRKIAQN